MKRLFVVLLLIGFFKVYAKSNKQLINAIGVQGGYSVIVQDATSDIDGSESNGGVMFGIRAQRYMNFPIKFNLSVELGYSDIYSFSDNNNNSIDIFALPVIAAAQFEMLNINSAHVSFYVEGITGLYVMFSSMEYSGGNTEYGNSEYLMIGGGAGVLYHLSSKIAFDMNIRAIVPVTEGLSMFMFPIQVGVVYHLSL